MKSGVVLVALLLLTQSVSAQKIGKLTDKRDGKVYKTVKIEETTWMAENLNYKISPKIGDSFCYDNAPANCKKWGRLYTWKAAMNACPAKWRLPTNTEWGELQHALGDSAALKIKAVKGWPYDDDDDYTWKGTDNLHFGALPGRRKDPDVGFQEGNDGANFWSASEQDYMRAYITSVGAVGFYLIPASDDKRSANSVRCVKD